ncbi:MAG: heparan-alpha-glucosaminide N-acetyltransferase domain-containing protein [Mucilaginibacter sp.]
MFLIKRGLWLMLMDVVVITFMFTLNPGFNAIVLEVLWAIGFSMVILGLLVRAPLVVIGVIGGIIFFGHNLLDLGIVQQPKPGVGSNLLTIFFTAPGVIQLGSTHMVLDAYAVIPWTGVMMLGYVFGSLYKKDADAQRRKKILLETGLCSIAFFILLRYINHYGDPAPWGPQRNVAHTLLSFLNTTKYPPSLLFLCMTLGPALILLSVIEGIQNKLTAFCMVYGNVPFFYFLAHLYLLRAINLILIFASGISTKDSGSPFMFQPPKFGYPLWTVYLIWAGVIAILYFPCRWFARYKKSHQQWWLSYL